MFTLNYVIDKGMQLFKKSYPFVSRSDNIYIYIYIHHGFGLQTIYVKTDQIQHFVRVNLRKCFGLF